MRRAVVLFAVIAVISTSSAGVLAIDADGDGLGTAEELFQGVDPQTADTDGDGLADGVEVARELDPLDGDGLTDGREVFVGTRPDHADSEYDGLDDAAELSVGTDPHAADTDGFDDRVEVEETEVLPDVDPLCRDIYVEVNSFGSVELRKYEGRKVVEQFQEAPVGPNGSGGWSLPLVYDDGDVDSCGCAVGMHDQRNGERGQYWEYRSEYFDHEGMGYHYLLVVPAVDNYGMRSGYVRIGQSRPGYMLVEHRDRRDATGSIFMHELGHSLGLSSRDFDGIDSDRYTPGEYRSVMNYELHSEYYGHSSGEPFNDWRALEAQFNEPSTDELDRGADE